MAEKYAVFGRQSKNMKWNRKNFICSWTGMYQREVYWSSSLKQCTCIALPWLWFCALNLQGLGAHEFCSIRCLRRTTCLKKEYFSYYFRRLFSFSGSLSRVQKTLDYPNPIIRTRSYYNQGFIRFSCIFDSEFPLKPLFGCFYAFAAPILLLNWMKELYTMTGMASWKIFPMAN